MTTTNGIFEGLSFYLTVACPRCSNMQKIKQWFNTDDLEYKERSFDFKCDSCNLEDKFHFNIGLRITSIDHKETKDEICPCCKQKAMPPIDELIEIHREMDKVAEKFLQWRVKINEQ